MGKAQFQKSILSDDTKKESFTISKAYEVTDKMEFIQFMNALDKKPVNMGGRSNDWRELTTNLVKEDCLDYGQTVRSKYKIYTKFSKSKLQAYNVKIEDMGKDFEMLCDWASSLDEAEFMLDFHQI
jgi:hypothetical protein